MKGFDQPLSKLGKEFTGGKDTKLKMVLLPSSRPHQHRVRKVSIGIEAP